MPPSLTLDRLLPGLELSASGRANRTTGQGIRTGERPVQLDDGPGVP